MKKLFLLILLLVCSSSLVFSKIIRIRASNFQFTPSVVNAKVGDTILWVWVNGTHTTTSLTVPRGALTWNAPLRVTAKQFRYRLTRAGKYTYHCTPHAAVMKGTINVTAALSADLNDFAVAETDGARALLTWNTVDDKEIAYYSLRRSTDGINFTEIAKVEPTIDNTIQSSKAYNYADNNPMKDKYVYYMLEMVDKNGNKQLSDIKIFTNKIAVSKLITSLSPNPITKPGHLMMQFNADTDGTMLVQLYNTSGTLVQQTQMSAYKGLNNGHFHLGELNAGTYYIVCTMGNIKEKYTVIMK